MQKIDVTGQTFNRLTVISYVGDKQYNCMCSCGNTTTASSSQLRKGLIQSCGCLKRENAKINGAKTKPEDLITDIKGKVFERLTVISYAGKSYWNCKCECGVEKKIKTCHLNSGATQSCGCLGKEKLLDHAKSRIKYTPQDRSAMVVWDNIYNNEGDDIKFEEFKEMSQQTCNYCGVEPSKTYNLLLTKRSSEERRADGYFTYNGLDRVDNNQAHIKENLVTCCFDCNYAKLKLSLDQFNEWISRIQLFQKSKPIC